MCCESVKLHDSYDVITIGDVNLNIVPKAAADDGKLNDVLMTNREL